MGNLAGQISEAAMNELCAVAAEYSDVSCTSQDITMYLERIRPGQAPVGPGGQYVRPGAGRLHCADPGEKGRGRVTAPGAFAKAEGIA